MGIPIDLTPIDAQGLNKHRPSHENRWETLENVIFRDGMLRPRPGFRPASNMADYHIPTVERGIIVSIMEIDHPDDVAQRDGFDYESETILPSGSSTIEAGWSGDHLDIDEVPADGVAYLETTTEGAQIQIDYANPTGSYDTVQGIVIRGRAATVEEGQVARMTLYERESSVNKSYGYVDIYGSTDDSDGQFINWQNFAVISERDLVSGNRYTQSDLDAINVVVELTEGFTKAHEHLAATGDGASTDWLDVTDDGTAGFADFAIRPAEWPDTATNGAYTTTTDAAQSWTYDTPDTTFATVTSFTLWFWFKKSKWHEIDLEVFFRPASGSTANEEVIETITLKQGIEIVQSVVTSTTNPVTTSAWTQAGILAGEFGVRVLSTHNVTMNSNQGSIDGTITDAGLLVDDLKVDIMGANTSLVTTGVIGATRLWSTTKAHLRYTTEVGTDNEILVEDVTNSVAVTSPGSVPLDWAVLYGQVYLVNGIDKTRRYPTSADVFEELTNVGANYITGKTVAAFADRILYGNVNDNGSTTPERIAYSKILDGGDHDDDSAGDFDLLDTPGGVVKLQVLTEDICPAYKETGVYSLRRTGNSAAPIIRDVIDFQTGCVARMTVKTMVGPDGLPFQLFLGWNPTKGLNIFRFDGSAVVAIGDPIGRLIRDNINQEMKRSAFAEVDPQGNAWWFFFATGTDIFPDSGYIYHIATGQWTSFTLPFYVSAAGQWTMPPYTGSTPEVPALGGEKRLILAPVGNTPYESDYTITNDIDMPATLNASTQIFEKEDTDKVGAKRRFFTSTLETGDLRVPDAANPDTNSIINSVKMMYRDDGPFRVKPSVSIDGGINFKTQETYYGGSSAKAGALVEAKLDINHQEAKRPRMKLVFDHADDHGSNKQPWRMSEMWIDLEPIDIKD